MKRAVLALSLALTAVPCFAASDVGFDVNINVGNRPQVVVPAPPPVVVPGPPVAIAEPPVFLVPRSLGFYVAVGVPYDLFYLSGSYYLWSGDVWYRSSHYNGPWGVVKYKNLPPGLRKHKLDRIRYHRDGEYRVYEVERDHYRGRHFRPGKESKRERKMDHERWKEERRRDKDGRRDHGGKGRGRGHDD
ncbi:hypothetical protein KIP69_06350 [Geobacter sulfurreducens]|uniref:Lipoprotein n=1 Tax=Geobacter sulfurreducens (strain ATCC 51573 / DSM 12127 / PCA) TaxID=243231 RepID=Q74DR8_GEOSL|nr:hypothetical protein [Geobacter sulfurreducens]AAR34623.1 hypothetical protein GSU1247 [Geobacter sulfurreducens PCA]ADI84082.1 hypothetical protein KN400_1221 [Geobacter sulfurreducens KN400]AJY70957.1 hypothetical protein RW64_15935 [Geobacter sulfurreducens]QVW36462.1 hypothetical protein KIP69_06350 [Geobacter sulfurreducens]UAC05276.1 hypothetical protein KVP06_06245 [Geobacter sulfurreducens]